MNIQELKDFIERPKLTMLDEDFIVPEKFSFLKPYFEKVEFVGKQSKHKQKYYKHLLLSDEAKKEEGAHFTPKFISDIVNKYIEESQFKFDNILDYTAGIGSFVFSIDNIKDKHIELWDINSKSICIAKDIAERLNFNIKTKVIDTLEYARRNNELTLFSEPVPKFDLLVLNPPFNLDMKSNTDFVRLALNMMSNNGKVFIVLPNGFTSSSNKYNIEFRKFLVDNKKIEAIFSLGGGIFENTQIPTTMLILSNDANEQIKIYDFESLDLPKVRVQTKTNPLTKREYYRDVKDYSKFIFKINNYKTPQNNDWLNEYSLIPRRMLINAEKEKKEMMKNEARVKENLSFLDKNNIRDKNKKLTLLVEELGNISQRAKGHSVLSEKGKCEILIDYELKSIEVDFLVIEILKILTDKNLLYKDKNKMRKLYEKEEKNINTTLKIIREALLDLLI